MDTDFDNICLGNIIEKEEVITAIFQGASIESGKFEYTGAGNHLLRREVNRVKDDLLNMLSCIVIIANTEGRQLLLVEGRSGLLPLDDDNFSFRDALAVWLRAWNE